MLVYLFALLALLAQLLLMLFCTWILFNTLKRRSYRQRRVNSRTSSQLTSDVQSLYSRDYSLPTGNSTLTNYYTNSNLVDSSGELDCLGLNALTGLDDLGKLKWTKEAHLWPIKLNKSCTSTSKMRSPSSATVFGRPTVDDYFNSNDICIS